MVEGRTAKYRDLFCILYDDPQSRRREEPRQARNKRAGLIAGSIRNVALTKSLADELGPDGINVTVVHPGATRTERTAATVRARPPSPAPDRLRSAPEAPQKRPCRRRVDLARS